MSELEEGIFFFNKLAWKVYSGNVKIFESNIPPLPLPPLPQDNLAINIYSQTTGNHKKHLNNTFKIDLVRPMIGSDSG